MKHTAYINRWIAFFPLLSSKKRGKGSKTLAGKEVLAFTSPAASSSGGRAERGSPLRIPASSPAVSVYCFFFPLRQVTEVPWASTFKSILGNYLYLPHRIVVRS